MSWPMPDEIRVRRPDAPKVVFGRTTRPYEIQQLRYGVGMVLGYIVVNLTKRTIKRIPVFGRFMQPLLDLAPSLVLGPVLGAAAVYGADEGDMLAGGRKAKQIIGGVTRRVQAVQEELKSEVRDSVKRLESKAKPHLQELEGHLDAAGKQLAPAIDRHYRELSREAERQMGKF